MYCRKQVQPPSCFSGRQPRKTENEFSHEVQSRSDEVQPRIGRSATRATDITRVLIGQYILNAFVFMNSGLLPMWLISIWRPKLSRQRWIHDRLNKKWSQNEVSKLYLTVAPACVEQPISLQTSSHTKENTRKQQDNNRSRVPFSALNHSQSRDGRRRWI